MFSALEIFLVMRYINLLFTHLLTYTYAASNGHITDDVRGPMKSYWRRHEITWRL